ncbi:MAG TPA: hypothetical protein VI669_18940 [Vicinamibacteria bacterium]
MSDRTSSYRILWAPCPRESDVGRRIGADRDIWIPYLVDGEGLVKFDGGQGVPFDDYDLAQGILAAYFEKPAKTGAPEDPRPYLSCALDELVVAFRRPSLEVMILELARGMGQRHGWALAREALRTGRALLPDRPQIACDYVVALWRMIEAGEADEPRALLHEILDLAPAVDSESLRPMAREYLALVHLGALAAAGEQGEFAAHLAEARRLVADPYLQGKLDELEGREGPLDPRRWDLFETRGSSPDDQGR